MARLSTHVLDTARGTPAGGVAIDLDACEGSGRRRVQTLITGMDGRAAGPDLDAGVYELTFHAGQYFRAAGVEMTDPPFLDEVVVRFGVAAAERHYHVPLLLSPYGYSTYRGS